MKSWQKTILIIYCLLGVGISFIGGVRANLKSLDKTRTPVHVNIEIGKTYMPSVSIMASFSYSDRLFPLSAEVSNEVQTVSLYSEIKDENPIPPLIYKLFLRVQKETVHETLNAIEGISIFINDKMFYFSQSDVINLQGMEQNGYMLYELNGLEYRKSTIAALLKLPPFINWYGDFNLAVRATSAFFFQPEKFIITWCFLVCLLILCWPNIKNNYSAMRKQEKPWAELLLLGFIVLTGFVLRLNGYVQYSSWYDELYSACQASNPNRPFMSAFGDPGNPPFYFILLRLWFILFGWTEQSGRLFSVLTGSAAIISLYILVKRFSNKKAAFLAAAYMAVSAYFIGFSQEMRAYILEVFLVSITVYRFLIIIQKRELSFIDLVWYIIPSVLLVNTHYYGSLFIFANFLFFLAYSVRTQTFTWKKTGLFFTVNLIIASSLLPYFIHTALRRALLNSSFNTWIQKPGLMLICIAVLIPLLGVLYIYLRKTVFKKIMTNSHCSFLDYSVFVTAAVYLIAFGISMYRPILDTKYLIILYPLLIATVALILTNVFTNSSKLIGGLCICFAFIWIVKGYEANPGGGGAGLYKEGQAYISRDAEAHPQNISVEKQGSPADSALFYGYRRLPLYVPDDTYDVLYINPMYISDEKNEIPEIVALINAGRVLRIRVNHSRSVYKIYSGVLHNGNAQ